MEPAAIAIKAAALLPKGWELAKGGLKIVSDKASYDFRVAHTTYCTNVALKYCKSRTFFVRDEPQFIDEFYVPASILRNRTRIEKANLDSLSKIARKSIVSGNGGSGKTVFMKHLIMDAIDRAVGYPVFIELRDLNDREGEINLEHVIFTSMRDHGFPLDEKFAKQSLRDGLLVILLDGFDELNVENRKPMELAIRRLAASSSSQIVVSSRPDMTTEGWDGFGSTKIAPLELNEACELIEKIKFDDDAGVKENFIKSLKAGLFKSHKYFLSNPLLLSIMLLTYGDSAEIPRKFASFYEQAYTALFQKHDALKSGFRRKRNTGLDIYEFSRLFSAFSAITYDKTAFRFTTLEAIQYTRQAKKVSGINDVDEESFLLDAKQAACLLVDDGLDLAFVHRSFQEYFVARFIDKAEENLKISYIKSLVNRNNTSIDVDNVMKILYEMSPHLVEDHFLIPQLKVLFGQWAEKKLSTRSWREIFMKVFSKVTLIPDGFLSFSVNDRDMLTPFLFCVNNCVAPSVKQPNGKVSQDLKGYFLDGHDINLRKISSSNSFWRDLSVENGVFSMASFESIRVELNEMETRSRERVKAIDDAFSFINAS